MESKVQQAKTEVAEAQQPSSLNIEPPGDIIPSKPPSTDQEWQEWLQLAREFLSNATDEIGTFFVENRKLLLNLLLILSGAVTVYIILSVLDAINDIPLLAPLFELVGLGYTGWFVVRYLLRSSTRDELLREFESLKTQVTGQNSQES
ncbi:MAG: CAAD domain-containing protein [Xenococcaceae cyanobacterium]